MIRVNYERKDEERDRAKVFLFSTLEDDKLNPAPTEPEVRQALSEKIDVPVEEIIINKFGEI